MFISPKNFKKPKKQTKTPQVHQFGAGKESYINIKKKKKRILYNKAPKKKKKKGGGSISMVLKFESTFGIPGGLIKRASWVLPPEFLT